MQAAFDILAGCARPILIVGGHALTAHGVVRQTIDVDCLVAVEDREVLGNVVAQAGYILSGHSENFLRYAAEREDLPEIDVLLVDAATFEKLGQGSVVLRRGAHEFRVPGLAQLIALKLHAIRNEPRREARDLADISELLRLNPGKISAVEWRDLCEKFGPAGIRDKVQGLR